MRQQTWDGSRPAQIENIKRQSLINLLDRTGILEISCSNGGERYVKNFDVWHHLLIMLYAVIKRFDSLREITDSMFPEARKLAHLGISMMRSEERR